MGAIQDTIKLIENQLDQLIDKENSRHTARCDIIYKARKVAIEGLQATCEHPEYRVRNYWLSDKPPRQYKCCNECGKNLGDIPAAPDEDDWSHEY